jgi:hypothetical protein
MARLGEEAATDPLDAGRIGDPPGASWSIQAGGTREIAQVARIRS